MKRLFLFFFITCLTYNVQAQNVVVNLGAVQSDDYELFMGGILANNIDIELFGGSPDLGDNSNSMFGGRIGYMIYLVNDFGTSVYVGPHVGGYSLTRNNFDSNLNDISENETSLNYGITGGLYFRPFNVAVSYGVDDLFESNYISIKVGFDIMGYL